MTQAQAGEKSKLGKALLFKISAAGKSENVCWSKSSAVGVTEPFLEVLVDRIRSADRASLGDEWIVPDSQEKELLFSEVISGIAHGRGYVGVSKAVPVDDIVLVVTAPALGTKVILEKICISGHSAESVRAGGRGRRPDRATLRIVGHADRLNRGILRNGAGWVPQTARKPDGRQDPDLFA